MIGSTNLYWFCESTNHLLAFNEFISEREHTISTPISTSSSGLSPTQISIALFDSIILSKRDRGRLRSSVPAITLNRNPFSRLMSSSNPSSEFLWDTSEYLWRTASASTILDRENYRLDFGEGRDYLSIIKRIPGKLEESLMREPRMIQGVPRITDKSRQRVASRKPLPLPLREK